MNRNDKNLFSFQQALLKILSLISRLSDETVGLHDAQRRISSADIAAVIPQPSFDESTRDGFVIGPVVDSEAETIRYQIVQEIPAGKPSEKSLLPGTTCRIMTGGCVPNGGARVVPHERCVEKNGSIIIDKSSLEETAIFIRRMGSEIAVGERLVKKGVALQTGHLALLASCGVHAVSVLARPSVGYICTGSELIPGSQVLLNGQKFSSNSFLLGGLLASVNACPINMGILKDSKQELLNLFLKVKVEGQLDAMITTGGMGPGKYDLVERAFVEAGGKVIFNAIAMRPGKSVLFGILGRTFCFGLPGPPHAVRTLLNELIGPALYAMQGGKDVWPKKVQANLQHAVKIKRNDVLQLKDGVLTLTDGRCTVRIARQFELGNCFVLLPPGQAHYPENELVDVHLAIDMNSF